jgi:tight adherence protein B
VSGQSGATRRRVVALAGATLAMFAVAAPGRAGVELRQQLDTSAFPTVRVTVVTAKPTSTPPELSENGRPVAALRSENLGSSKNVVIAIDRSSSMRGRPLADAVAAARRFLESKEPDDQVAIVTFGADAVRLTGFSGSTADAEAALASLSVGTRDGTALYDAVALSAKSLARASEGKRLIVLLTDGRDVSSDSGIAGAVRAAQEAGSAVYAVGIAGNQFTPAPLRRLAAGTGGAYYLARSSGELTRIYGQIAAELRRTWRLEYLTATRPGQRLNLAASVAGQGTARAVYRLPAKSTPGDSSGGLLPASVAHSAWAPGLAAFLTGLLILFAAFIAMRKPTGSWARSRVDAHVGTPRPRKEPARRVQRPSEVLASLYGATERTLGRKPTWERVRLLLERADLPLRTVEFFYLSGGVALLALVVSVLLGAPRLVVLVIVTAAVLLPYAVVSRKARRRVRSFDEQLPDVLLMLSASLRAGHSLRQGIDALVEDSAPPTSTEFRRVLAEASLGRPVEQAMADMARRLGSADFDYVVSAIAIQREVGGTLAGLLEMVAETIRSRQQFRRKVRALTSMGRLSAYVLISLPFAVAVMLQLVNPGYMQPLFETSVGHQIIVIGLLMMVIGSLLVKKTVTFKG